MTPLFPLTAIAVTTWLNEPFPPPLELSADQPVPDHLAMSSAAATHIDIVPGNCDYIHG